MKSFIVPSKANAGVLFLHGGGESNSSRYTYFQKNFVFKNLASLAFDFVGDSLNNRLQEAETALEEFIQRSKISRSKIYIWGSSMGGHIACRLIEKHPDLGGIILQSAAAYSKESENLPFGPEFTQAINQFESWRHSPAFTALENYFGNILVVYGEHDAVIPKEVQNHFREIAQEKSGQSFILYGGSHSLLCPKTKADQMILNQLGNLTLDFLLDSCRI